jgi:argininosuccinate lyase
MQEDKEGVFDSVKTAKLSLSVLDEMLAQMGIDKEAMERACNKGHLSATDLADYLVKKIGVPFRDAYHIVGNVVNFAEEKGVDISELGLSDLQSIEPKISEDVLGILDNKASMNARRSKGGTATIRTKEQIEALKSWLEKSR